MIWYQEAGYLNDETVIWRGEKEEYEVLIHQDTYNPDCYYFEINRGRECVYESRSEKECMTEVEAKQKAEEWIDTQP